MVNEMFRKSRSKSSINTDSKESLYDVQVDLDLFMSDVYLDLE